MVKTPETTESANLSALDRNAAEARGCSAALSDAEQGLLAERELTFAEARARSGDDPRLADWMHGYSKGRAEALRQRSEYAVRMSDLEKMAPEDREAAIKRLVAGAKRKVDG
jgi:hypothetical protein